MAYMRGEHYVYSDGESIHVDGASMLDDVFDELCAMRWAELTPAERKDAELRAIKNHSGNFGCDKLRAAHGLETAMERILKEVQE